MRVLIILGLCVSGCYSQQPVFPVRGNTFPVPGQFNPNLATNTLNTGAGFITQGFQPGTQFGVRGFQSGVRGFQTGTQPGVQGFQPGVQSFQSGVQSFQPGVQGFQPGVQSFQPGVQSFQPGVQGFQPGVQSFQPGVQGFQPGVRSFQPGVQMPQPGLQPVVPTFQPGTSRFQPGVGVSTNGINNGVFLQNQIRTGMLGQPNQAIGGFSTPFGPFSGNGLPFVFNGFRGQAPTMLGPLPPVSPLARLMMSLSQNPSNFQYATCTFNNTWNTIRGRADFRQFLIGDGRQQVNIRIQIAGLPQTAIEQERGLHIHEFGDIGDSCARVGPHFNPSQTPHGSQRNFAFLRHVGDLGNMRQSTQGLVSTQYSDNVISLKGINSIVGRSMVIKFERDDEGMVPGSPNSRVNGNTREPIACCTVGRTNPRNWHNPLSGQDLQYMGMTGIMPEPRRTTTGVSINTNPNVINPGNINTMVMTPGINTNINPMGMTPGIYPNINPMGVMNTNFNTMGTDNFNPPGTGFNGNINRNPQTSAFRASPSMFGAGSFSPGVGQGQTFNFNQQGKKRRRRDTKGQ